MDYDNLKESYTERHDNFLVPLSAKIEAFIEEALQTEKIPHVDKVFARAKGIDSFVTKSKKLENKKYKYSQPLEQIQDQIGVRIVVYYVSDLQKIEKFIRDFFRFIGQKEIVPESHSEFGYEGLHYILFIPTDVISNETDQSKIPKFFELQVKTLFQHAWAQANHDLSYKPETNLTIDQKRKIAFTAAQSWGADQIFDELYLELSKT